VPDFTQNPFDLLIADHCTHFTSTTLSEMLARAGFDILGVPQVWVPKEVSVAARPGPGRRQSRSPADNVQALAANAVGWLSKVVQVAGHIAEHQPFGIFGTSIAATWLAGELADTVAFFVDEDPSRIGRGHLGKLICRPEEIPVDAHVLIALAGEVGESVAGRLRTLRPDVMAHTLPSLP
jgi:hypothetical protein